MKVTWSGPSLPTGVTMTSGHHSHTTLPWVRQLQWRETGPPEQMLVISACRSLSGVKGPVRDFTPAGAGGGRMGWG